MKYFCLPSDFKFQTVDAYREINHTREDAKISETYGQMAPDTDFGSCRLSKKLPEVNRDTLEKYVQYCSDRGIEFNYVVNATCMENDELTTKGYRKIRDFFRMLREIGVSSVTIALPSLMEIALHVIPEVKIKASTVCQINSPLKAKFYEGLGIKRLVLDEDIYRDFDTLKNIRKVYSGELEIIVNSFCTNDCPYKMFDYNSFSHAHIDKETYPYYSTRCKVRHIGAESFMKLNWIRPEDLHYYYDIGIRYFKIQGRTTVYSGDPVKAVNYYINGRYDGDLIKLLELFSTKRPMNIADVQVDNRKLNGFLDRFVKSPRACTKVCSDCGYCKRYGEASVGEGDRLVMDMMQMVEGLILKEYPRVMDER